MYSGADVKRYSRTSNSKPGNTNLEELNRLFLIFFNRWTVSKYIYIYICFITWSWEDEVVFPVAIIVIKKNFWIHARIGRIIFSNYSSNPFTTMKLSSSCKYISSAIKIISDEIEPFSSNIFAAFIESAHIPSLQFLQKCERRERKFLTEKSISRRRRTWRLKIIWEVVHVE